MTVEHPEDAPYRYERRKAMVLPMGIQLMSERSRSGTPAETACNGRAIGSLIRRSASLTALLLAALVTCGAHAQTEVCDELEEAEGEVALSVFKTQHPYDRCDATIDQCLSRKPVSPFVLRLADSICKQAQAGRSKETIEKDLSLWAQSVTGPQVSIDISEATAAGDPEAKIEIVAYVCMRCPFCATHTIHLYKSLTAGRLKGKARLFVRPFVLRSHVGSTAGAMALLAAQKMGRFWDMLLHMYENFDEFEAEKLPEWAASKGMDADRFRDLMDDAGLRLKLVESVKEGIRNQVKSTPAVYVNRRKYAGNLSPVALEDFVEAEYERRLDRPVGDGGP